MIARGETSPLFLLAIDHRGSFERGLFQIDGRRPTRDEHAAISAAKDIVFDALLRARARSTNPDSLAVLVDEEYGSAIAAKAAAGGVTLAIAAEKSGQAEFDFEYGDDFAAHLERFHPDYVKVLTRYNPAGSREANERQATRLRQLSDWASNRTTKLLLEVLVPATEHQLAEVGDLDAYERLLRPRLMREAVSELQDFGVEPNIWKVEGLLARSDCKQLVEIAQRDGRDQVRCLVLGRAADDATVRNWLRVAASVDGYGGFAIGRSIWWDPLVRHLAESESLEATREEIAARFEELVDLYTATSQRTDLVTD